MAATGIYDEKLRFSIVLALTADSPDRDLLWQQDERGRHLGMTRAEIKAARQGLSFDHRSAKAIALALACRAGSSRRQRGEALRAGIDAQACAIIERLAGEAAPWSSFERKQNET
ncbi:hypothetical protein [Herbaspirillum sp. YR522]|uniref:hypothetical protein n=1 Tax=Herbaspirillum sp. YR522 TaxID=1144342 RepID=UPI00026FA276|nr:hypothetical protein [Herbaspirillum sp. YR522]EJN07883.1 hypothetical protein PMI40_01636 [Herbaspirillum sp. YR522]